MVQSEMGEQLLTLPADRYTAPAGVLIAPQYRSGLQMDQSQVDPLEAAESESGLRSVPFPILLSLFRDFTPNAILDRPTLACSSQQLGDLREKLDVFVTGRW